MQFIFMLTRRDATVADAVQVLEVIRPLGIRHIGFKDVGVDTATMRTLAQGIRAMGARSYLEIVSETRKDCLVAARTAVELGVDCVLGSTDMTAIPALLNNAGIDYLPYAGRPHGTPAVLAGTAAAIAADCERLVTAGCSGCTLLAYRAATADPMTLIRTARSSLGPSGRLVVAGSVDSVEKITALAVAGVDAFTIGSSLFDGSFVPHKGLLQHQLQAVLATCRSLA